MDQPINLRCIQSDHEVRAGNAFHRIRCGCQMFSSTSTHCLSLETPVNPSGLTGGPFLWCEKHADRHEILKVSPWCCAEEQAEVGRAERGGAVQEGENLSRGDTSGFRRGLLCSILHATPRHTATRRDPSSDRQSQASRRAARAVLRMISSNLGSGGARRGAVRPLLEHRYSFKTDGAVEAIGRFRAL